VGHPAALNTSVRIKDTSEARIGVDYKNGEIVVFRQTQKGVYHGYAVGWNDLQQVQRNALVNAGLTSSRGQILDPRIAAQLNGQLEPIP
jgi:hypothetical protein